MALRRGSTPANMTAVAASLIPHGLIDEHQLFLSPVVVGGGTPLLPSLDTRIPLRLAETRHFNTAVMLRSLAD